MQLSLKDKAVLILIFSILIFSAFMFLRTNNTIANVSALEIKGVGVYWDSQYTDRVNSIAWGNLTPGSSKSIVVYIRNEVNESTWLIMSTMNWTPPSASSYMTLGWNYARQRMNPSEALQITLTLSVSRHIEGISNFSFNILITGINRLPGDVNGDGSVDSRDLGLLLAAYGSYPGDPNWNPAADFDGDGYVGSRDLGILLAWYGTYG
jgi:hypothetical protein